MKHLKTTSNQQQEQTAELHSTNQAGQEFASVEDLLRHDARQTTPPPAIEQRLRESLRDSGDAPRRPWWRRLLD